MKTVNKKINIFWRDKKNAFQKINKGVLQETQRRIGSSRSAVTRITSNAEEMKVLMPNILGFSSNAPDFELRVKHYWDSLSEPVYETGKSLEIGYIYDSSNQRVIDNLAILKNSTNGKVDLKTDDDIEKYFEDEVKKIEESFNAKLDTLAGLGNVIVDQKSRQFESERENQIINLEGQKYKYGLPINTIEYLLYRYCLVYRHVANSVKYVNRSSDIRFYLYSEEQIINDKEVKQKIQNKSMKLYIDIIGDKSKVDNALFVLGLGHEVKTAKNETQKQVVLSGVRESDPARFIEVLSDKNIAMKGEIEKLISYDILKRVGNSTIVVDGRDPSKIIGNSLDEVIAFFSNEEKNKQIINEYRLAYKQLKK